MGYISTPQSQTQNNHKFRTLTDPCSLAHNGPHRAMSDENPYIQRQPTQTHFFDARLKPHLRSPCDGDGDMAYILYGVHDMSSTTQVALLDVCCSARGKL